MNGLPAGPGTDVCEQCNGEGVTYFVPGEDATETRCTLCFGTGGDPHPDGWRDE